MGFRQRIAQFMHGRSGMDNLCRFILIAAIVLYLLASFFRGAVQLVLAFIAMAALVLGLYRMLSRSIYRRRQENAWYLKKKAAVFGWFRSLKDRWRQRKDYRFFRCPSCRTLLRVPRGKGKLLLTCRKCGNRFERRT